MSEFNENYNENLNDEPQKEEQTSSQRDYEELFTPEYWAEREEAAKLKKCANTAGVSFIICSVASFVLSVALSVWALFSAGDTLAFSIIEDPMIGVFVQSTFSVLILTLPFVACYKIAGYRISDLISFGKTEKGIGIPLFLLGVSFCAFANVGASYVTYFLEGIGIVSNLEATEVPAGIWGFLMSVIATALVPALVEEFALRGLVLGSLRKFGDGFALIASSLCFGIMHGNLRQIPFAIMVGLFLGFTVLKTNSLRVAMAVHFTNNLISVLIDYFPKGVPTEIKNLTYIVYLLLALVLGILVLRFTNAELLRIDSIETALSTKKKYKAFFLSGGIIAFIILYLLEVVSLIFI